MATMTFDSAAIAANPTRAAAPAKPGFFSRLGAAMMESRRRKADIEVRRALAAYGQPAERLDYALLPFAGE
jgi:hypothetical protein